MKGKKNSNQAVEMFSNPKKVFKTLDRFLTKQDYEFLIKAETKGFYSIYSKEQSAPIVMANDVLKTCMGLLYFEYGVGKTQNVPNWSMPQGYIEDGWNKIISQIETPKTSPLQDLNKFLDTGSTVYLTGNGQTDDVTVVLTNNYSEDCAKHISVKADSFSDGLKQANAMANYCLNRFESNQQ